MNLQKWLWEKFALKEDDIIDPSRRSFLRAATVAIPAVVIGTKLGILDHLAPSSGNTISLPTISLPTIETIKIFEYTPATLEHLSVVYYDRMAIENLKANLPFERVRQFKPIKRTGKTITLRNYS